MAGEVGMNIDAMRQALAALETNLLVIEDYGDHEQLNRQHKAITALRAAIEQAQEPVAWISESENLLSWDKFYDHMKPLYTAPREWQGLTADEIWQCNSAPPESAVENHICMAHQNVLDFAEAIEAKLRERNA